MHEEIFWIGWDDREAKRHFMTAFSDKPGLFVDLVFATVLREP